MEKTDLQILDGFLAGDKTSFELIVARYTRSLYRFAFRLVSDSADAEDIVQDSFVKVWKSIRKFDRQQNFKAWLFTIARNNAIDLLRKRRGVSFSALESDDNVSGQFEETIPDLEPIPDEVYARQELAVELEKALAVLKHPAREVILLHDIEELTFDEIATIVNQPLNTVKSRYRRAMHQIRPLLRI